MKEATGITHGKIILIGEHSVVYHQPCIAIPFLETKVIATVKEATGQQTINCSFYQGQIDNMPELMEGLHASINATLAKLNKQKIPFSLTIESTIPIERGMGSSAAVSGAAILALHHFFESPLSHEELLSLIQISESVTHGKPSGIDALTTTSQNAFYFKKDTPSAAFNINLDADLIIADTGVMGKTKEAVEAIAKCSRQPKIQEAIQTLGLLTDQAKEAIINHNIIQLGSIMNEAHQNLKILNVSSKELDQLVEIANKNGALGSKLTGGGKGGCMIALCYPHQTKKIEESLKQYATNVWCMSLKGESS